VAAALAKLRGECRGRCGATTEKHCNIFHLLEYLELILPNQATDGQTFLSNLYAKTIILPRQARDKHRENSKEDGGRTNALKLLHYSLNGQEAERLLAETLQ
jgi:hypothetical protein